ncbi:ParB/RepB/Spo0J family partition protein [Actinomycetospora soli]|uniref:ParB/RepB/Spo0J family partition protein n=1 Tax=Actinomycetospora soli TaxID=2893887 RepID=UPI001E3DE477|nr:ParB/RepB/Spo0J family partition protein [Actinomycetospora soli]MCD2191377.1 ParB/RepB/Spo0J family partition protein [Actinomycetospora soli]
MTAVAPKKRGRTSFASFAEDASISTLPAYEQPAGPAPTSAPLPDLSHNPHNPRDGYDDDATRELAASMESLGQLQPATVVSRDVFLAHYPDDTEQIGVARWVVIMGNRRLAAAHLAGLDQLAITVADHLGGTDPKLTEALLVENLHREALPPLLEARELQALVELHGSNSAVARRIGKTDAWVSQRLGLRKLAPEAARALQAGELSFREARGLASKPAEAQLLRLAELRGDVERAPEPPPAPAAAERPRRGRPKTGPPPVEQAARKLREQYDSDDIARLVELLTAPDLPR